MQYNPLCGDRLTLHAVVEEVVEEVVDELDAPPGGRIRAIRWSGQGCALSQASASLLVEQFAGRDPATFDRAAAHLRAVLRGRKSIAPDDGLLGDAIALSGAARLPSRIKCVMLAWVALEEALGSAGRTTGQD